MTRTRTPGGALTRRLAAAEAAVAGLREELVIALSVVTGLRRQVEGRDATIRALEAERDVSLARAAELAEALGIACTTPASAIAERDLYRAALADIEAVLHRLGTGCGFAGHDHDTEQGGNK